MKHNIVIPDKLNFTVAEMFKSDYAIRLDINNVTSDAKILTDNYMLPITAHKNTL